MGDTFADVNPWGMLAGMPEVVLKWHDEGPMGLTTFATKTISLRKGMTRNQRRCTILHELLHLERGPTISTLAEREELAVRRETARLMIPSVRMLGEALAWSLSHAEAAYELDVDEGVLHDRLKALHPAEIHYLRQRLADIDH